MNKEISSNKNSSNENMKNLTEENIYLKEKFSKIENVMYNFQQTLQYIVWTLEMLKVGLLNEFSNRQSRNHNLMLFHLPEETYNSLSDFERLKSIFRIMEVNIEWPRFTRVGKLSEHGRPIKLFLPNTINILDVIRAQTKLILSSEFKDIRFTTDRTPNQRHQMNLLKQELKQYGSPNTVIKFINGNPTIVNHNYTI